MYQLLRGLRNEANPLRSPDLFMIKLIDGLMNELKKATTDNVRINVLGKSIALRLARKIPFAKTIHRWLFTKFNTSDD